MADLSLESTFTFGKHKGEQLEDVIEDDPSYIEWLVKEEVVGLDEEVCELITKRGIV
jgi:hypothetical protein